MDLYCAGFRWAGRTGAASGSTDWNSPCGSCVVARHVFRHEFRQWRRASTKQGGAMTVVDTRRDLLNDERLISADSHVAITHDQVRAHLASAFHPDYDEAVAAFALRMSRGTA